MKPNRLRIKEPQFSKSARINSTQLLGISSPRLKPSSDLPPINPELCLSRSSLLEKDKKTRLNSYVSHKISTDISHLLDSPSIKFTPKTATVFIENLYADHSDVKTLPPGRIEIEHLKDWLESMKNLYIPDLDQIISQNLIPNTETVKKVEEIYLSGLKEITKQVSVQSKLRAELLDNIFSTCKYIWTRYPEHLTHTLEKERCMNNQNLEQVTEKYQAKVEKIKYKKNKLEQKLKKKDEEKEELEEQLKTQAELIDQNEDFIKEFSEYRARKLLHVDSATQTMLDLRSSLEKSFGSRISSNRTSLNFESPMSSEKNIYKIVINPDPIEQKSPIKLKIEEVISEVQQIMQQTGLGEVIETENFQENLNQIESLPDWLEGFKLGLSYLSKFKLNEENKLTIDTQNNLISINQGLKIRRDKKKTFTPRKSQPIKLLTLEIEENTSSQLLKSLLEQSQASLQKYKKISKNKILKHVNQALYFAMGKKFSREYTLADLVLQQFCTENNVRSIAERKFKELIVGCVLNSAENLRIKLFMSALSIGSHYNYPDFSLETSEIYIKMYEFMINSKIGIIFDAVHVLDVKLFPLSRAYECIKQIISPYIHQEKLNSLLASLKKQSEPDQYHVNKEGVINIDLFIDTTIPVIEDFIQSIYQGVKLATETITEYNYLNKRETRIIFRHLMPKKMCLLSSVMFDECDLINIEDFRSFCINNKICTIESIARFYEDVEKDLQVVFKELDLYESEFQSKFNSFTEETLTMNEWLWKFQFLLLNLKSRKSSRYLEMWHLLKKELDYCKVL